MPFSNQIKLSGKFCILMDPDLYPEVIGRANSYRCPIGFDPGIAWVLIDRASLVEIKDNATHTLQFGGTDVIINSLYLDWALRLGTGGAEDPKSVYLVKLQDRRVLGAMTAQNWGPWHNMHAYNKDGWHTCNICYEDSEWQDVINDIWPNTMGTPPQLGFTPVSDPHDISLAGSNPWLESLPWIFERLGIVLVYTPQTDSFSIKKKGEAGNFTVTDIPVYDADAFDYDAIHVPEAVYGIGHVRFLNYGGERDTENDDNYVFKEGGWFETESLGNPESVTGTTMNFWLDTRANFDIDNVWENETDLENATQELADGIKNDGLISPVMKIYADYLDIETSGKIKTVLWYDFGDGSHTQYVEHSGPPSPEGIGKLALFDSRREKPLTWRPTYPNYPRVSQIVQVRDVVNLPDLGTVVTPNTDGVHPGYVLRYEGNTTEDEGQENLAWIFVLTHQNFPDHAGDAIEGQRYIGRLVGSMHSEGLTLPLYAVGAPGGTGEEEPLCEQLRDVFNVPDGAFPAGVQGWVPRFNESTDADSCVNVELKNCPAPSPLATVFDTFAEVADASSYQAGDTIMVTADPDNTKNGIYMALGPAGGAGTSWVSVATAGPAMLAANPGSLPITGTDATIYFRVLTAEAGALPITGRDANINYSALFLPGSLKIDAPDAKIIHDAVISAESGSLPITGTDATLTHTP